MKKEINIKGYRRIPDIINGTPEDKYTKVKNDILRSTEYSAVEVKVLGIICSNKDGWVSWLSTILSMMQEGETSVKKAMQGLEEKGHIKRLRYKEAKTGQYVGSFMSSSMKPGQHNIEETIKMLEEDGYIVTDKLGRNVRKIQKVENPQGGNRPGGDPVGGDGGTKKNNNKKTNPKKKKEENYSKRNSQEFLHSSNSSAIENKEEDSNSGFAMRIPSSNFSNKEKENLLNYFNKNTHEYKLINNFFDSEFQAARRAAADKLNAGDIKKFQRMKNRLKHEPGELNAAENIYKILPEDIRHKIDLYIEREHKTWDKSTIKDHNSWRLTRIFEYLKCAPHVFHWTKLSQDQKEEYISKCQKEIAQYKSRNKKSKKRANSASFKQAFGTA